MKQSTFFEILGALVLALSLVGCSQDPLIGKSASSASSDKSMAVCNLLTIYGASTTMLQAKVRYPKSTVDNVPLDQRLLMKVVSVDNNWWNWATPVRTQFYRKNAKTGLTDQVPLQVIYYWKGPTSTNPGGSVYGERVTGTFDYFSNEVLKAVQSQFGLSMPPTDLNMLDILIDGVTSYSFGTKITYEILSVRFDSRYNDMSFANILIPEFYANPQMFSQTHRQEDGYALTDELNTIHPFKDYAGQPRDFAALANSFCF